MGLFAMLKGEEPNPIERLLNYHDTGQYGEYATEYALGKNNIPGYRKTAHNVYLPYKGHTTELDIVMVHEKGIFVFESKNYSGWIFGSADQQKWTQRLQNGETHLFYNPLKQNAAHCAALSTFLDISDSHIFSYIVFSERCELKKIPEDTAQFTIVRRPNLLKWLRRDLDRMVNIWTPQQVDRLAARLQAAAQVTQVEKQAHVDAIKARTDGQICPYCGARLVVRRGKHGTFYGCSAYPKCRFTRKMK